MKIRNRAACATMRRMAGFARATKSFALLVTGVAICSAAHFHHLHLNATDPAAAISFYTSRFDCEK